MGLLDRRITKGKIEYLVSWLGYDINESTWEPKSILDIDAPLLVNQVEFAQYLSKSPGKKYCICGGIDNGSRMIHCCKCQEYYHLQCIDIDEDNIPEMEKWECRKCIAHEANQILNP